jgi:hypothetical protein
MMAGQWWKRTGSPGDIIEPHLKKDSPDSRLSSYEASNSSLLFKAAGAGCFVTGNVKNADG